MNLGLHARIIPILLLMFFVSSMLAQKAPAKFGKIDKIELETSFCPIDSNAHAYFIFDFGDTEFNYAETTIDSRQPSSSQKGFQLYFSRHFRIKVIDNQGFDWGDIEIPLYHDGNKERLTRLKAITYNLEGGKVVKTKLKKSDVYAEETNKYWTTEKFAMPNVKSGSVIEVEYTIVSDFYFNMREWYFQKTIPVLQSEYHVSSPDYFTYHHIQRGYYPIELVRDSKAKELNLTFNQKAEGVSVQAQSYSNSFKYRDNILHFYAKEVPAFPMEQYLRTAENYISKLEFELKSTALPNSMKNYYSTSWEKINANLMDAHGLGKALEKVSHLEADVELLKLLNLKDEALMNAAYNLIKMKLSWDGYKSKYASQSLSKTYKKGSGNSADVNLNLVALLGELGFSAQPMVLSTQDHGIIHPAHPSLSRFNFVVAAVMHNNQPYLMDATVGLAEINLLPIHCLNDKGFVLSKTGGKWLELMNFRPYTHVESNTITLDSNLNITGTLGLKLKDYASYKYKREINQHNNLKEFEQALNKKSDLRYSNISTSAADSSKSTFDINCDISQENYAELTGDVVLFAPVVHPFIKENPFTLEKREYPIEYDYTYSVRQFYSITIPENYELSELPKSAILRLPDSSAKFVYNITQMGNVVNLTLMFNIDKTIYLPEEYAAIKGFHEMVVSKQNELIVLKAI